MNEASGENLIKLKLERSIILDKRTSRKHVKKSIGKIKKNRDVKYSLKYHVIHFRGLEWGQNQ